ncbi:MAG: transporter substrate-binding domain-containing protein [Rhodospirillales bacterium]|jgi:ABC-type amino acid transport substrate-binding protein|nr:transporter substrate-binding domain-containing protein [Rhodospirillales bacterium]
MSGDTESENNRSVTNSSQDVDIFLTQLKDGKKPGVPEFQGPEAASLRAMAQALLDQQNMQVELLKITEYTRKSAQQINHLQRHAEAAGTLQGQFATEIDQRSINLRQVLDVTRNDVDGSTAASKTMQDQSKEEIVTVVDKVSKTLESVNTELGEKSATAEEVLKSISQIGNAIKMLYYNATIEAGRAGDAGLGFAVVAEEVRALAHTTLSHVEQATKQLDFRHLTQSLMDATTECDTSLTHLNDFIGESMEQLGGFLHNVDDHLHEIEDNNQVVFEILEGNQTVSNRGLEKIQWANKELYDLTGVLCMKANERMSGMQQFLSNNMIHADASFDRLERIKSRGILRVAIEPSFVGLSFRLKDHEPLQGLDSEYAQALAKSLGVQCEFVEYPWDALTEVLSVGRKHGEQEADVIISALPPDPSYSGVAYSETYTYLDFVLCRKVGDNTINSLNDLDGKVLGIINDPGAFTVLENAGVRWNANENVPGGRIKLANLIAYSDQSRIHDCLADGIVNAFAVDLPIYHWACTNPVSPWHGKIEILPGNLAPAPYYYSAAVSAHSSSYNLLAAINAFIRDFKQSPERKKLEEKWQGKPVESTLSYRDEDGNLLGEDELKEIYLDHIKRHGSSH